MKRRVIRKRIARLKPFGNPNWGKKYDTPMPSSLREYVPPEDEGARAAEYLDILEREKKGEARRGAASRYRKEYLPEMTPQEAIKKARAYGPLKREPREVVVDTGEINARIPSDVSRFASSADYGDPFDVRGKTIRPLSAPRKSSLERVPQAVGPVQKAMSLSSGRYAHYRDLYEREKDAGHINIELRRKVELYQKLSRDTRTLLEMLRAETQEAFVKGTPKGQKARKIRRVSMLERAMKMVVNR